MLILNCPNCGPRNASEFRYGGEVNPRPPASQGLSDEAWAAYLYVRPNRLGVQSEWWYHRVGCGLWFLAERHTYTGQVTKTYLPPATEGEGERAA